jgi:hypothetical protein
MDPYLNPTRSDPFWHLLNKVFCKAHGTNIISSDEKVGTESNQIGKQFVMSTGSQLLRKTYCLIIVRF